MAIGLSKITLAAITALALSAISATAQDKPAKAGAARTVHLFDAYCFDPIPEDAAFEKLATDGKWQPVTGAELQAYAPVAKPDILKAWTVVDQGLKFRVAFTQHRIDAESAKDLPGFEGGFSFACSLILPADQKQPEVGAGMEKLMGRKADGTADEGPFNVTSWTKEAERSNVIISHYRPKGGKAGGLISITVMVKPKA